MRAISPAADRELARHHEARAHPEEQERGEQPDSMERGVEGRGALRAPEREARCPAEEAAPVIDGASLGAARLEGAHALERFDQVPLRRRLRGELLVNEGGRRAMGDPEETGLRQRSAERHGPHRR